MAPTNQPDFPLNQLGLSMIPAIMWMAALVVLNYGPVLVRTPVSKWKAHHLLCLGIIIGTATPALTNVPYWGAHFLGVFLGVTWLSDVTWAFGQAANFFSRYLEYYVALPMHLAAAYLMAQRRTHSFKYYMVVSAVMTGMTYVILTILKSYLNP